LLIVALIIAAVIILWFIITYNHFIKNRNLIKEAWSGIDVQLKRRHNLIPDISGMLKNLFLVVEDYPDLKANVNFLDLQSQLIDIEDQLQYSRRYYNGTVRNYNIRVESFPGNIIAGIFGFKPEDFFEITLATERKTPKVEL